MWPFVETDTTCFSTVDRAHYVEKSEERAGRTQNKDPDPQLVPKRNSSSSQNENSSGKSLYVQTALPTTANTQRKTFAVHGNKRKRTKKSKLLPSTLNTGSSWTSHSLQCRFLESEGAAAVTHNSFFYSVERYCNPLQKYVLFSFPAPWPCGRDLWRYLLSWPSSTGQQVLPPQLLLPTSPRLLSPLNLLGLGSCSLQTCWAVSTHCPTPDGQWAELLA